jgi:hypothetical protein
MSNVAIVNSKDASSPKNVTLVNVLCEQRDTFIVGPERCFAAEQVNDPQGLSVFQTSDKAPVSLQSKDSSSPKNVTAIFAFFEERQVITILKSNEESNGSPISSGNVDQMLNAHSDQHQRGGIGG